MNTRTEAIETLSRVSEQVNDLMHSQECHGEGCRMLAVCVAIYPHGITP